MDGFDDAGVFFSDNFFDSQSVDGGSNLAIKKQLKEFLRDFHSQGNFTFKYRDQIKNNYLRNEFFVEVSLDDLASFNSELVEKIRKTPGDVLPLFEEAAKEVADEVTRPRSDGNDDVMNMQVTLRSAEVGSAMRDLSSEYVSKLVKIPGIIVAATGIKAKATSITIQCRSCRNTIPNLNIQPGYNGYAMPRKCNVEAAGRPSCPLDPYFILPDKCKCVDFQSMKLQETPDSVPHGEMPRHCSLYLERSLVEKAVPGNRVSIIGVYCIRKQGNVGKKGSQRGAVGVRDPYIRVLGIEVMTDGPGRASGHVVFTGEEEERFRRMAAEPRIYERITKSIAPSIYGSDDIKKAIACLLFGGSRKRLPDGLIRRGDINVLLLGDPGTAKSQLLKFVERVAPICVYTSGKGSSAAGLTASVMRDHSRNGGFVVEGGAMVLADGGVVCIDEFDKMKEDDRVSIHEAMEQQTISIAKAGITTTLNSRCSVLAAANSVCGRWDDTKGEDNIDFMPTILSRFDTIFIVKDTHDEERDSVLARHVMGIHMNAAADQAEEGELSVAELKKYISYCRTRCGPRLEEEAAEKLKDEYVMVRRGHRDAEEEGGRLAIPITVRQLEAIVRISESLAKMELKPFASISHVNEAIRLFKVSTLSSAKTGELAGAEGFTTEEDQETIAKIEKQLKKRFAVGSQVSEHSILGDFERQKYPNKMVLKVVHAMVGRGELVYRMQRRMLYRLK